MYKIKVLTAVKKQRTTTGKLVLVGHCTKQHKQQTLNKME